MTPVRETSAAPLGFALTFLDGRGVLSLEGRPLGHFGRVDRLEMEIPDLRFPFDVSGGVTRFQNRRCRLRELELSVGSAELSALVHALPLASFGIFEPELEIDGGRVRLSARASFGKRHAFISAIGAFRRVPPHRLRFSWFEVRVYGFLPVPAPLVGTALFMALGAKLPALAGAPVNGHGGSGGPGPVAAVKAPLVLVGPTDMEFGLLDLALDEVLVTSGWRLPEREDIQLRPLDERERIVARFGPSSPEAEEDAAFSMLEPSTRTADLLIHEESRTLFADAEAVLLRGEVATARDAYRRAAQLHPNNTFAVTRLLQILAAVPATLAEADEVASVTLARWPDFAPALLCKAQVAAELGRGDESARIFERLGELSGGTGETADQALALLAAAEQRRRKGAGVAAAVLLEQAVAARPRFRAAWRALAQELEASQRWPDLLKLLRQRAVDELDPTARARIYTRAGFIYLDKLGDKARARDRFDQAVRLDDKEAQAWEGLGRTQLAANESDAAALSLGRAKGLCAARGDRPGEARVLRALAKLDEATGQPVLAIERLRTAAELDKDAWEPLRDAAELALVAGRPAEAKQLLEAALARAQVPPDRASLLRQLAAVHATGLSDRVAALMLFEQVLRDDPGDIEALDGIEVVLAAKGDVGEMEPFLRRAIEATSAPGPRRALQRRLRDLARQTADPGLLREALAALGLEGGEDAVPAAFELWDLAHASDSDADVARAVEVIETLLTAPESPNGSLPRADLSRRLAFLLEKQGQEDTALAWLRACLEGDAQGPVAAAAWQRFAEIAARRGDAQATAQALVAWADDGRTGENERQRASHLAAAAEIFRERLGLADDALALLERAVSLDPQNDGAFAALEQAARAADDFARVAEVLSRRAEHARPGELRGLQGRLAEAFERLGRSDEAARVYRRLIEDDPGDLAARAALARQQWGAGHKEEAVRLYTELVGAAGAPGPASADVLAEAHLRLGQWARVAGQMADAGRHLHDALVGEPTSGAPLDVLVEVLETSGRAVELAEVLRKREDAADAPARRSIARARAGVIERLGDGAAAEAIYRRLLEETPDDTDLWLRLAEIFRREGRSRELSECLERLWSDCEAALVAGGALVAAVSPEALAVELAALYREPPAQPARAEGVLRRLLELRPGAADAMAALGELLATSDGWDESDALLGRQIGAEGARVTPELVLDRAKKRLAGPGGEAAALALLRLVEPEAASAEALALRAILSEKAGDISDAVHALRRLRSLTQEAGDADGAAAAAASLRVLVLRNGVDAALGIEVFEDMLAATPDDAGVATTLFELYRRLPDPRSRNRAWSALLALPPGLNDVQRGQVHLALAETAADDGDLAFAQEEFSRALAIDSEPLVRVSQLVGHARVLVAMRESAEAMADLEEALALLPNHAGALVLAAELMYRAQEWQQARVLFAALAAAPGGAAVIEPELLAFRRAELAEVFGDDVDAEAAYRQVVAVNPKHIEAREALAQMALYHEDWEETALQLDELLRLYPADALEKISETRRTLGEIRFRQGDFAGARAPLELVLDDDPDNIAALELLRTVFQHLGLVREAADLCGRLARLYPDASQRAEALFVQGEILRKSLGDLEGADDAYLRSSDMDPAYAPTLVRLVHHYWVQGDFANVADVGQELVRQRLDPAPGATLVDLDDDDTGLLVAISTLMGNGDAAVARSAVDIAKVAADRLAARLAELGAYLQKKAPEALDPVLGFVTAGLVDQARAEVVSALRVLVLATSAAPGPLLVLGRLAEQGGDVITARAAYAVLLLFEPEHLLSARRNELQSVPLAPAAVFAPEVLEPAGRGPLAEMFGGLAAALAGFPPLAPAAVGPGGAVPPAAFVGSLVEELRGKLNAPAVTPVVRGSDVEIAIEATLPLTISMGERVPGLTQVEFVFLVARALEEARAGTYAAARIGASALPDFLRGVLAALSAPAAEAVLQVEDIGDLGRAAAAWLSREEVVQRMSGMAAREKIHDAAGTALATAASLDDHLAGRRLIANRVGLLACGSPLAALRAVAALKDEPASKTNPRLAGFGTLRREQLMSAQELRDMVAFLLSDDYRRIVGS